jgi:serine/threonine-protein kinase
MIGEVLKGRYRLEHKLGEGAMGQVYRATDLQAGELVAIKTMSKDLAKDEAYRKRFSREAAVLSKLRHPNIVGYVDAFTAEGSAYLVTEYFAGGDLRHLIRNEAPMSEARFKGIALKIVDAVSAAHQAGIIHRDLKPENILMSVTGEPHVADFGLARDSGLSTMTASGTMIGTLAYMPPEAFDSFVRQDHRGDIWALGVIFFEMLTGNLPFRARSQTELIAAILSDTPMTVAAQRRDVAPAWSQIIERALSKDIHDRYESAADLLNDLRNERLIKGGGRPAVHSDESMARLFPMDDIPEADPYATTGPGPSPKAKAPAAGLMFMPAQDQAIPPVQAHPRGGGKTAKLPPIDIPASPGPSMGLLLLTSLFLWSGVLLTLMGGGLFFLTFTRGEEAMGVTFANISIFQTIGSTLFAVGVFFEVFQVPGWRRGAMVILAGLAGLVWFFFFSGILVQEGALIFANFVGTMIFLGLILVYFQIK